ncbi:uncharacterized protein JCM10292_002210 [Rhodotorula paludigena]|uniref:uncharacterized protein n=1 Tax=Rhodotorula paludigena TaxID=86838 RepID=UPI00317A63E4
MVTPPIHVDNLTSASRAFLQTKLERFDTRRGKEWRTVVEDEHESGTGGLERETLLINSMTGDVRYVSRKDERTAFGLASPKKRAHSPEPNVVHSSTAARSGGQNNPGSTHGQGEPANEALPLDAALGALVLYTGPRSTSASAPSTPKRAIHPLRTTMTSPRAASTTTPVAAVGAPFPLRFGEPTVEEPDEVVTASSLFPHLYGPRTTPFSATSSPSPPKKARFDFEGAASRSPFALWAASSSSASPASSGMHRAVPSNIGASTSSTTLDGDSTLMVEELF